MDDLKEYSFADFRGGWNCVDDEWLLPKDETAVLEDWDLSTLPIAVRPKFSNLRACFYNKFRMLGIHPITWAGQHRVVIVREDLDDNQRPKGVSTVICLSYSESNNAFLEKKYLYRNWYALPTYATVYRDAFYITNGIDTMGWLLKDIFGSGVTVPAPVAYYKGYGGKYMAGYDNRLWVTNTSYASNLLLCTKIRRQPNIPFAWLNQIVSGETGESMTGQATWVGDDMGITGLTPAFGNLYAWKKDSVYLIEWGAPVEGVAGYSCKQILKGYGAVDQRCIIIAYNSFIFLDPSGKVYMWDGTENIPRWISRDIDCFFKPVFGENRESVYLHQGTMLGKYNWSTHTAWTADWEADQYTEINDDGYVTFSGDAAESEIKTKTGIYFNPDTEKVGLVTCCFEMPFSEGDIPANYTVAIDYGWTNDINTPPSNWIIGILVGYWHQKFGASFMPSERTTGNNYLWLRIHLHRPDILHEKTRVYGITVNYYKDDIKGSGGSSNTAYRSMKYCLPNAFFHNNAYYLSVADDFTPQKVYESGGKYYADPCNCNKLLVFTLPKGKDSGAWTVWKDKEISCADTIVSDENNQILMLGLGYPHRGTVSNLIGAETFPANADNPYLSQPRQKLKTTSTDCGFPKNDKEFRMLAVSFIDRGAGKFRLTWYVNRYVEGVPGYVFVTGSTEFETTGNNLTTEKIIELTSPESASGNYGRRIQFLLESIDNGYGYYGRIDLIALSLYYKTMVVKADQGEQ